jgi:hypothetical protein
VSGRSPLPPEEVVVTAVPKRAVLTTGPGEAMGQAAAL